MNYLTHHPPERRPLILDYPHMVLLYKPQVFFFSPQDTVVALQALVFYAAFSGSNAINLKISMSGPSLSSVPQLYVNYTNYRKYQSYEVANQQSPIVPSFHMLVILHDVMFSTVSSLLCCVSD